MSEVSFRALGLTEATLGAIESTGFTTPTPIQREAIPVLLSGRDAILRAQTGTGKTAAFGLSIIDRLDPSLPGVRALVLTPTRELAQQVAGEIGRLGAGRGIATAAVYGGSAFEQQLAAVAQAHVVIATPGRLLDVIRRKRLTLSKVHIFGLDEADEMLSLGFEKDVREIAKLVPATRQTFLCSATIGDEIKRLAGDLLRDPVEVDVSSDEVGARSVNHVAFKVPMGTKLEALFRLLATEPIDGAIIFANTKAETFRIHEALAAEGFGVGIINGDLSQDERERALAKLRDDRTQFLVATDVAARGIDVSGLPAVVNFDLPEAAEVYVHRTGRTGRAGQFGVAYSLLTAADVTCYHTVRKFYRIAVEERELPSSARVIEARAEKALKALLAHPDADLYGGHLPLARRVLQQGDPVRAIARLLALASRPTLKRASAEADTGTATNTPGDDEFAMAAELSRLPLDWSPSNDPVRRGDRPRREDRPRRDDRPRREDHPRRDEAPVPAPPEALAATPAPAPADSADEIEPKRDVATEAAAPAAPATEGGIRLPRRPRLHDQPPGNAQPPAPAPAAPAPAPTSEADTTQTAGDEDGEPGGRPLPKPARTGADATADDVFNWIASLPRSRRRGRWRSDASIATAFGVSLERAVELAEAHAGLEKSEGPRRMYRTVRDEGTSPTPTAVKHAAAHPAPEKPLPATAPATPAEPRGRHRGTRPAPAAEAATPASPTHAGRPARPDRSRSEQRSGGRGSRGVALPVPEPELPKLVRVKVNVGSDAFDHAADLIARLADVAGLDADDFGSASLESRHSFVEIRENYWRDLVAAAASVRVGGRDLVVYPPPRPGAKR